MENVMVETNVDSEDINYVMDGSFRISPRKDTSIKSTFNETSIPDVNANVSNTDANINSGEQPSTSLPYQKKVTPPEVLHSKSNMEEDETSNINVKLSDKDKNVTMGDGGSITTIDTSTIPPPPTSPPQTSTIPTSIAIVSPTFEGVMQELVAALFSSQSTDIFHEEEEKNDDDVMVAFVDLQFNPEDEDVPENAIMSGNQFKILKSKMNSIFAILERYC
ncbi:unnamed protein product [Lactuca saligna]|uniref:Uncharacterized protein n=1 Tax=Lactuca saligna TaxID=75948 RepID=A0AA35V9H7_LACSI|nr:unnamed protein product [Lactuca saligna]